MAATRRVRGTRYLDLFHSTGDTRNRHCTGTKQPGCVNDLHFRPPWSGADPTPMCVAIPGRGLPRGVWMGRLALFRATTMGMKRPGNTPVLVQGQAHGFLGATLPRDRRKIACSSRVRFWCDVHSFLRSPTASAYFVILSRVGSTHVGDVTVRANCYCASLLPGRVHLTWAIQSTPSACRVRIPWHAGFPGETNLTSAVEGAVGPRARVPKSLIPGRLACTGPVLRRILNQNSVPGPLSREEGHNGQDSMAAFGMG